MIHPDSAKPKRRKTGGRRKGTPNKSTVAIKEAMLSVFAELQAGTGSENGHFLEWAKGNSTEFYRLASKLLPLQVTGEGGGPVVTRIELVAPSFASPSLAGSGAGPGLALPHPRDSDQGDPFQ